MAIENAADRPRSTDSNAPSVKVAVHVGQSLVARVHGTFRIDLGDKQEALTTLAARANLAEPKSIVVSEAAAQFLEPQFELVRTSSGGGDLGHCYRPTRRERTGFGPGGRGPSVFGEPGREVEAARERPGAGERGQ